MEKLYYHAPYLTTFRCTVKSCTPTDQSTYLITLDQTAFYPEGGGQPYDTGMLGEARVLEVHEKGETILHTTDAPLEPGTVVTGTIDWPRRFSHMQNHSGEHILSGMIHRRFGYDNVGFHMGTDAVTVDFNGVITPEELIEVETAANRLIYQDVPILTTYPSEEELQAMDYRSKKELSGAVRIVTIPDGDICACCGTHVETTGAIGMIKTTGMIHYKGGVRISMLCGEEALEDYRKRQNQVIDISHLLSAKADTVTEAVAKLKAESGEKDMLINNLYQQIFAAKTAALPDSDAPLCLFEEQLNPVQLRQFCTLLYEQHKGSLVAVCSWNGTAYQFALGSGSIDVRPISKALNQQLEGRGGGSSLMVQGMWNASEDDIRQAIRKIGETASVVG